MTPLHVAAQDGQLQIVQYLVEHTSSELDARDNVRAIVYLWP
jgi:ankyrin repeat protein